MKVLMQVLSLLLSVWEMKIIHSEAIFFILFMIFHSGIIHGSFVGISRVIPMKVPMHVLSLLTSVQETKTGILLP